MNPTSHLDETSRSAAERLFAGPGDMRARCRALEWCTTRLGGVHTWSQELKSVVQVLLGTHAPAALFWGPEFTFLYNDATSALLGNKHPGSLGLAVRDALPGTWKTLGPKLERIRASTVGAEAHDMLIPFDPGTGPEETWMTVDYVPVRRDDGSCAGVLSLVSRRQERTPTAPQREPPTMGEATLAAELAAMKRLHEVSTFPAEAMELQPLLETILGATMALQGADFGTVQLYDRHSATLHVTAQRGFSEVLLERFGKLEASAGSASGRALARRERVSFEDVEADDSYAPSLVIARAAGYRALQATPLFTASGEPIGVLSTYFRQPHRWAQGELRLTDVYARFASDAIARTQAEAAMRESQAHLHTLVQNVRDYAIFMLDAQGFIREWPEGAARVMGYSASEVLGKHFSLFFTPEDMSEGGPERELREASQHGRAETEAWHVRKGGQRFWADEITTAIHNARGEVVGFTKLSRDRSEQKRLREQREHLLAMATQARAQAEEANRAKDEFLAIVSHELRTPLAPILLWSRALRSGQVPMGDLDRALEAIVRSAESQSRLIEDLLDLSRLQSGRLRLLPRSTPVAQAVRAAFEIIHPTARTKGVTLELEVAPDLGVAVLDAARFQQVLWNLLSNGVKFTPSEGRVALRVRRHADQLEVEVADTGQGISAEFLPLLFQRFRQANMGEDRHHPGLGIGLALCRHLVELHGGSIEAHSEGPGRGALFRVRLPWREGSTKPSEEAASPRAPGTPSRLLRGLQVLLVEDDVSTREVMQWTLEQAGARVLAVGSGPEALDLLAAATDGSPEVAPEVIVCDIGLPGMNGHELLERIHALYRARGQLPPPACAVSAHARDIDRRRAIEAGFELYVAKPVSAEELLEAMEELALTAGHDA